MSFFKKFYLKSDTKYTGELNNPEIGIAYLINLFLCKLNYIYVRFVYNKFNKIKSSVR